MLKILLKQLDFLSELVEYLTTGLLDKPFETVVFPDKFSFLFLLGASLIEHFVLSDPNSWNQRLISVSFVYVTCFSFFPN
jgi:hypothetical protein